MKARPNDPCPCGSGRKYKKCHGAPAAHPTARPAAALSVAALLAEARRLQDSGRLEDAEQAIQAALERAPGDADAWQALGDLAERAGDFETARACYARLVELHPGHAPGFFRLGNVQARLFAFAQARKAYQRAIASPLCDAGRFASDLEGAYRAIWRSQRSRSGCRHRQPLKFPPPALSV